MGLGSALSTAVSGLNVNQSAIDVIGNNLANTNTVAFKSSRNEFVNNFYNTLGLGSTPGANGAGTNPRQVGQGAIIGSIGVDFRPGAPTQTGKPSDLFIQGNGFFVVRRVDDVLYTRDGSFRLNSNAELVTAQGARVQGFPVDASFNIQRASLVDLTIPLGKLRIAQSTENATIEGTLNPTGTIATQGTSLRSAVMLSGGLPATATSTLQSITVGGVPMVSGTIPTVMTYTPNIGGRSNQSEALDITATTTLGDLANFMVGTLGINTGVANATGAQPGAIITPAGELVVTGNMGASNDFVITSSHFSLANNGIVGLDFPNGGRDQTANGESTTAQFVAYDSLGSSVDILMTSYLEQLSTEQSVFRILFQSPDQRNPTSVANVYNRSIGVSTLTFNADGQLVSAVGNDLSVLRDQSGATSPFGFRVDMDGVSALSTGTSRLAVVNQDGSPAGTLVDYGIDANGVIFGSFDNGVTRNLGQVALARFSNSNGLVAIEQNLYRQGPNSGLPFTTSPGDSGVGSILSGALELSNVDVAESFVQLVTASTAFSANSRVIATTQDLFQTLLNLPRG